MKYNNFLSRAVRREKPTMSEVIGDLHHGVIWLLLRTSYVLQESFTFSFSYPNWGICHLNPTGLQSLNNREKTKESPQVVVKWRQCANTIGLHCFPNFLLGKSALHFSPFSSRLCCFRQRLHRWTVKKQSDEVPFTPLLFSLNLIWLACSAFWSPAVSEGLKIQQCLQKTKLKQK